jgi:glycerol-3-phosphate O-acyltransferase / dihydroxyacetone phosphate acyltransferase
MVWHLLKYCVTLFFPVFYKRIQGRNVSIINSGKPMVIVMNHPNAFTDPILFTYLCYPTRPFYIARGDAFKPGFAAWFLRQLRILPVFRKQDGGIQGLMKNDDTYAVVNRLLKRNHKIIVFGEGICIQERRLRPLKKGVARMVFGAYAEMKNKDLQVVPVCVNYSKPDVFRSEVFYNVGDPLTVSKYDAMYNEHPAKAQNLLLRELEERMQHLLTHINDPNNDILVLRAETIYKEPLLRQLQLKRGNLHHEFIALKKITERVNNAPPVLLDLFRTESDLYFAQLESLGITDDEIQDKAFVRRRPVMMLMRSNLLLIGLPIYLVGLAAHGLQLYITHRLAASLIREKEFYSSVAIGAGSFVFLIFYALIFIALRAISEGALQALVLLVFIILSGWFALYYQPAFKTLLRDVKILKNPGTPVKLREVRWDLINLINKF